MINANGDIMCQHAMSLVASTSQVCFDTFLPDGLQVITCESLRRIVSHVVPDVIGVCRKGSALHDFEFVSSSEVGIFVTGNIHGDDWWSMGVYLVSLVECMIDVSNYTSWKHWLIQRDLQDIHHASSTIYIYSVLKRDWTDIHNASSTIDIYLLIQRN